MTDNEEKQRLERAKNVDLITFPPGISSINCFNCRFIKNTHKNRGYCSNKNVKQEVSNKMCCNLWDRFGTTRQWEK